MVAPVVGSGVSRPPPCRPTVVGGGFPGAATVAELRIPRGHQDAMTIGHIWARIFARA